MAYVRSMDFVWFWPLKNVSERPLSYTFSMAVRGEVSSAATFPRRSYRVKIGFLCSDHQRREATLKLCPSLGFFKERCPLDSGYVHLTYVSSLFLDCLSKKLFKANPAAFKSFVSPVKKMYRCKCAYSTVWETLCNLAVLKSTFVFVSI